MDFFSLFSVVFQRFLGPGPVPGCRSRRELQNRGTGTSGDLSHQEQGGAWGVQRPTEGRPPGGPLNLQALGPGPPARPLNLQTLAICFAFCLLSLLL